MRQQKKVLLTLAFTALLASCGGGGGVDLPPSTPFKFSQMITFGDSLSDAGNVFASSSGDPNLIADPIVPPYYQGRMSNGANWTDQLADRLGMSRPGASLGGGTNYAWAGATSGSGQTLRTSLLIPGQKQYVDNVGQQIQTFSNSLQLTQGGAAFSRVGASEPRKSPPSRHGPRMQRGSPCRRSNAPSKAIRSAIGIW